MTKILHKCKDLKNFNEDIWEGILEQAMAFNFIQFKPIKMDSEQLIHTISADLWHKTSFRPDATNIQPFLTSLQEVDPCDLIVYNFLHFQGTYLEDFLLSIFPLWKNFDLLKWQDTFRRIKGNRLAEYYMNFSSKPILGIDPGFDSTNGITISAMAIGENQLQDASIFLPNTSGRVKEIYEIKLKDKYGILFNELVEVNQRLVKASYTGK